MASESIDPFGPKKLDTRIRDAALHVVEAKTADEIFKRAHAMFHQMISRFVEALPEDPNDQYGFRKGLERTKTSWGEDVLRREAELLFGRRRLSPDEARSVFIDYLAIYAEQFLTVCQSGRQLPQASLDIFTTGMLSCHEAAKEAAKKIASPAISSEVQRGLARGGDTISNYLTMDQTIH